MTSEAARVPLIAGNWKMNFNHCEAMAFIQKLAAILDDAKHDHAEVEVAIFPPFTDLRSVGSVIADGKLPIAYGAQDLSEHDEGPYTGQISGGLLQALGCRYVLVGHSERREYQKESDDLLRRKMLAAYRHNLVPVLCVGEPLLVREAGEHSEHVVRQLDAVLGQQAAPARFSAEYLTRLVVAYEPVWAIGTGETANAADAGQMATTIRRYLDQRGGESVARSVRILYGGSVQPTNIASIMQQADVDGALVGGASLKEEEFASIIRFRSHVVKT